MTAVSEPVAAAADAGAEARRPLLAVLRGGGGLYPLAALGGLTLVDNFQSYAFFVLGPEIAQAIGLSKTGIGTLVALKLLATTLATLPLAAVVQGRPIRARLASTTAVAWSIAALFTGLVTYSWQLMALLLLNGAASASVVALHRPLLLDSYPPSVRVRTLSAYRAFDAVGNIGAPLLVGALAALGGFTWRGVFIVMALVSLAAAAASLRLRDPGTGRFDEEPLRARVRDDLGIGPLDVGSGEVATADAAVRLGFFEIMRRLWIIPTVRRMLAAQAVLGMMLAPLNTYLIFFLDQRWDLGPGARSLFFATLPVFSIGSLVAVARRNESLFATDPARLLRIAGGFLVAGVLLLAVAVAMPVFAGMYLAFGASFACVALTYPAIETAMLSCVPADHRPHASALAGVFLTSVGGFGGLLLLGSIDRRFGTGGAICAIAVPGVIAGLLLRSAAPLVEADLTRRVEEVAEEERVTARRRSGERLPLLDCSGIDFSYGTQQVLFGVDLRIDEGEIIALLGTNGAGKSTILRVISGLGLPERGTVRLAGEDITFLDAERRVGLGVTQIPGGKASYGPLTVAENLRIHAWTLESDPTLGRAEVERRMEEVWATFPRLDERRSQTASTLSGGERQMLALAKALLLRPRLLLVDELSLGLAPKVVGELLELVRAINRAGTAVVLVEQSVNVALSIADHAYFLERGQVRFDGPARDLLGRGDLLRSVFLGDPASDAVAATSGRRSVRDRRRADGSRRPIVARVTPPSASTHPINRRTSS